MSSETWTSARLEEIGERFEGAAPDEILKWAVDTFGDGLALATGFGPSGIVLMHVIARVSPETTIFYLDTDLLFPETHELKRQLAERLGIRFTRVHCGLSIQDQALQEGASLWRSNPDKCCFIRKVLPLRRFLSTRDAWITGIRRDQSPTRNRVGIVEWDTANGLVKVNPLAGWTESQVWQYLDLYDLPYNPLHDRGYPSIGCIPCTKAVNEGEDPRAGRWRGHAKLECGIHASNFGQTA